VRRLPRIVPLAVAAVALSGCGTGVVPRSQLDHLVSRILGAAVHRASPDISCDGDLPARVGATQHCVLSVNGQSERFPVLVRVDRVNGSRVHFTSQVGNAPRSGSG
jgi:hypothetical protein